MKQTEWKISIIKINCVANLLFKKLGKIEKLFININMIEIRLSS